MNRARLESNKCMMAGYIIRRAFGSRNLFRLPTCALHVCENSPVKFCMIDDTTRAVISPMMPNFIVESRRAFAKGRKSSKLIFDSLHIDKHVVTCIMGLFGLVNSSLSTVVSVVRLFDRTCEKKTYDMFIRCFQLVFINSPR